MLSFLTFLIAWYNLPFTLMLGLGVILAGLQVLGLSHDGDADADAGNWKLDLPQIITPVDGVLLLPPAFGVESQ